MSRLFRQGIDSNSFLSEEIPFYDPCPSTEECILSFLHQTPPKNKARILTLFEPTGTGKTTIINQIPKLNTNIYLVTLHPSIASYIETSKDKWLRFFGAIVQNLSQLKQENKSLLIKDIEHSKETPFITLSEAVDSVLGQDALLFIHLDECQMVMDNEFLKVLYSLTPCSKNVKMIFTGTTALGNDEIQGMSEFDSIACPPLPPFTAERVRKVLNNVLFWEELVIQNESTEQTSEIKRKIEKELEGTPKNILYFLQELSIKESRPITKQLLQDTLDGAYYTYRTKQKKMLDQLVGTGKHTFEDEALFEKLVMIFSYPNEFDLVKDCNGVLTANSSNSIIKYLIPFNHSGLVRINPSGMNTISLAIPNNFTLRYIREKTLYFPKEWLHSFNSSCTVASTIENVKGYCVQIWLAIMLLNQHSLLSAHIHSIIKKRRSFISLTINSNKKNYSTFQSVPEVGDVKEPKMAKDGKESSCVDVILPFSAFDENRQKDEFNLVVQITCHESPTAKAKSFFDRILNSANSKSDKNKRAFYGPCISLFLSVHPLAEQGTVIGSIRKQLENNDDLLFVQLCDHPELFPDLELQEMTKNITLLQKWIKDSHSFLNIDLDNKSPEREVTDLSDKNISPYGNSQKKRKIESSSVLKRAIGKLNIGSLDKSSPKGWTTEQVRMVLLDKLDGVGLSEKRLEFIEIEGSDLENIVDALIGFNGDTEAKIEHAVKELDGVDIRAAKSIVRWASKNLVTTEE